LIKEKIFMKTEMKLETYESTIIRIRRRQAVSAFCQTCGQEVLHLTIPRAAAVLQISEKEVFHLVENESVHSLETATGSLFICGNSVSVVARQRKK
jgi:hypothetical protein